MFKRMYYLLFSLLIMLILYPNIVNATSGWCSHHGGVTVQKNKSMVELYAMMDGLVVLAYIVLWQNVRVILLTVTKQLLIIT